jgi:hypothetical protein
MLPSRQEYENLIYTLPDAYSSIKVSTLRLIPTGAKAGRLVGTVTFGKGIELRVFEAIDLDVGEILDYGYTVYRGEEKEYWYDPQEHPDDPSLASTYPHHKHIHPNIKRNRVPAPNISFTEPNLPFLIEEIERELL